MGCQMRNDWYKKCQFGFPTDAYDYSKLVATKVTPQTCTYTLHDVQTFVQPDESGRIDMFSLFFSS